MLKKIKVRNFYSIGEEQELSLEITSKDILDDSARKTENGDALNLVSCIIGHNASGKTTVLKAINFLFWLIDKSYTSLKSDAEIPLDPHKLKENESTNIEIEFLNKAILYTYAIELNQNKILKESFGKKIKRTARIFELSRDNNNVTTIKSSLKINDTDEVRFKERFNVPLLSSLINTGYLPDITFFKYLESNVSAGGLIDRDTFLNAFTVSKLLHKDELLRLGILKFSKDIDLGISDFKFNEVQLRNRNTLGEEEKAQLLRCTHTSSKGSSFALPVFLESNGTQHSLTILSEVLPVLKTGGLVVLDEVESGLHPYVAKKIISLFENKESNPHNAQLIFSTHQHLLLNDRTKTQIFLAERDNETFETEIYRLDDIEGVRNDENYFHKYIAGAYGGTPRIDWL